jgi:hypothetical protein
MGSVDGGVRPSISSSSVWQTPHADTFTSRSSPWGAGGAISTHVRGLLFSGILPTFSSIMAFMGNYLPPDNMYKLKLINQFRQEELDLTATIDDICGLDTFLDHPQ